MEQFFALVEFSYNDNYHSSIPIAPFKAFMVGIDHLYLVSLRLLRLGPMVLIFFMSLLIVFGLLKIGYEQLRDGRREMLITGFVPRDSELVIRSFIVYTHEGHDEVQEEGQEQP